MSCDKVEAHGFCTSKILLSWQVQIQIDINSSVVTQHLMAEWPEAEILGGVRGCREPVGRNRGEGAVQTSCMSMFLKNPLGCKRSFSNSRGEMMGTHGLLCEGGDNIGQVILSSVF